MCGCGFILRGVVKKKHGYFTVKYFTDRKGWPPPPPLGSAIREFLTGVQKKQFLGPKTQFCGPSFYGSTISRLIMDRAEGANPYGQPERKISVLLRLPIFEDVQIWQHSKQIFKIVCCQRFSVQCALTLLYSSSDSLSSCPGLFWPLKTTLNYWDILCSSPLLIWFRLASILWR